MTWDEFLETIADDAELRNRPRKVFLLLYPSKNDQLTHTDIAGKLSKQGCWCSESDVKNDMRVVYEKIEEHFQLGLPRGRGKPGELHKFLRQRFEALSAPIQRKQTKISENKISPIQLLLNLDYVQQNRAYEDTLINSVLSFLIRAKDPFVQKWLVKRLANQLDAFGRAENIECWPIDVSIHCNLEYSGIDSFWPLITLGGRTAMTKDDAKDILKGLYLKNKTVVVALYRIEKLNSAIVKDLLMFWQEIHEELNYREKPGDYSKLLLFLTDTRLEFCPFESNIYELEESVLKLVTRSDPLRDFPENQVNTFLLREPLASFMEDTFGRNLDDKRQRLKALSKQPQLLIDEICCMFGISNLALCEEAWDLEYES